MNNNEPHRPDRDVEHDLLVDGYAAFISRNDFVPGDIIKPKSGIWYYMHFLSIVLEVIDPPAIDQNEDPEGLFSRLQLDLLVGTINPNEDGNWCFVIRRVDSRLMEHA